MSTTVTEPSSRTNDPAQITRSESRESSIKDSEPGMALPPGRVLVQDETLSSILEKVLLLRSARAAGPKGGDAELDVTVNHGQEYILLPEKAFGDEQNLLMIASVKLASELGYQVILYQSDRFSVKEPTKEVRDFWTGFILGIDDQVNLSLEKKSNSIELGRACAHAFRVRGDFRKNDKLGLAALQKNQIFFGNDPKIDPRTKVLKDRILIDNFLSQYLDHDKDCAPFKKMFASLLEKLDLDRYLTGASRNNSIKDNLVTLENVLDPHRRIPKGDTRPKKKESKKAIVGKLPEKPTTSPVMTKEEFEILGSFLSPLWSNVSVLGKDWSAFVQEVGFKAAKAAIDLTLKTRWEVVENLSTITTKRLRELKAHMDDSRLTKRKISQSDFSSWYRIRSDAKAKWLFELSAILKPIATLSLENAVSLKYPKDLVVKARKFKEDADQLKFTRASDVADGPTSNKESRLNPYDSLVVDEELIKKAQTVLQKSAPEKLATVHLLIDGKQKKVKFARANLREILEYALTTFMLPEAENKRLLADAAEVTKALNLKEFGPNSIVGKIVNDAIMDWQAALFMKGDSVFPGKGVGEVGWLNRDWLPEMASVPIAGEEEVGLSFA